MHDGQEPTFTVAGNRLTLLTEGPERLSALLALIDGARHSLRFLFYIWEEDASGVRVRDALVDAARRGVRVSLIVDGLGSEAAGVALATGAGPRSMLISWLTVTNR